MMKIYDEIVAVTLLQALRNHIACHTDLWGCDSSTAPLKELSQLIDT